MKNNVTAYINLNALLYNFRQIKNIAPHSRILAIIKSDAYRHGAIEIAKALTKADAFGVASIDEALQLRNAAIKKPIVLLKGFFDNEELQIVEKYRLETVIHNCEQLQILENYPLKTPLQVWIKIDTGMHRLGFLPHEVQDAYARLMQNSHLKKPLRIMSHFSDADNPSNAKNMAQLHQFQKLSANLEGEKCLANSSAILNFPRTYYDWIRPGITLYGASPMPIKTGLELGLKPVMTLTTKLIATKRLKKADTIGYGSTWECPEDMPIGIINVGYGDGYPRHTPSGTPILINGIKCQIIGSVAMDMINVDLRNCQNAKFGDEVTLWGPCLPVEEIAKYASTIPYELFCHLTNRVKFIYKYD